MAVLISYMVCSKHAHFIFMVIPILGRMVRPVILVSQYVCMRLGQIGGVVMVVAGLLVQLRLRRLNTWAKMGIGSGHLLIQGLMFQQLTRRASLLVVVRSLSLQPIQR